MVLVFLFLMIQPRPYTWETLGKVGYLRADTIWSGSYWGVLTSGFVHISIGHLAIMVWLFWLVGRQLERLLGWWRYTVLLLASAMIGSSVELAVAGVSSHGAGDMFYAIAGCLWMLRKQYGKFGEVWIRKFFVITLGIMFLFRLLSFLHIFESASAGGLAGLVFGIAFGGAAVGNRVRRRLALTTCFAIAAVSFVPIFYCPWSIGWLSVKANNAHLEGDDRAAIGYYTRIIEKDATNGSAYRNRGIAYEALGESGEATADYAKADELESRMKEVDGP